MEMRKMTRNSLKRGVLAAAVAAIFGAGYVAKDAVDFPHARAASAPQVAATASVSAPQTFPDFATIVKTYGPAVVNIRSTGKASQASSTEADDPATEFFRRFAPQIPRGNQGTPRQQRGMGSGFIVSPDGMILTNAHVVEGMSDVVVKLIDRREYKAKVLGADKRSDIAVIKIEAKNLPVVKLGDPEQLAVGEWVLAIGSPFGFENTATSGIVSAKARSLPDDSNVRFIQTDVAVNPGNSGGPLFNLKGEVVGINSQIYSQSGGYQGLSFAIPIDTVLRVKDQLVAHGKVTRSRIGVVIQEVNQSLADSFGLGKPEGALVASVEKDGPAAKAGIEPGDVIVRFNGFEIDRSADLPPRVADLKPGTRARADIVRKGGRKTVDVVVAEMTDKPIAAASTEQKGEASGRLGLAVRPLQPDEAKEAGLRAGLVVQSASGPAEAAGIQQGDVILALNGTPVTNAEQLKSLAAKAGRNVALLVQRDKNKLFVPLDLG
jgi:serine protease Do